tara:strand:+ start:256 stop:933 length:678 start_codon:yes stop_codon:yes gene_type:complete
MKQNIYSKFNFTNKYKKELIKFVKNMCNVEIGGTRFYDGTGTHYQQNPYEITDLIFFLKKHEKRKKIKFKNFLEIGYSAGVNNTFLNKFFKFKNIVAIDIVNPAGINTSTFFANLRFKNISLICGNSTDKETIKKTKSLGPYDLIFIDGGHEYNTVKKDFINYSKVLDKNGVIVFHDIKSYLFVPGVPHFWQELKKKNKKKWLFKEIYYSGNLQETGIGIISKKN